MLVLVLVLESGVGLANCWSTAPSRNCPATRVQFREGASNRVDTPPNNNVRARARWLARINIGKQIIGHRFRSRFRLLDGEFDLIINFFLDAIEIIQVRATAD